MEMNCLNRHNSQINAINAVMILNYCLLQWNLAILPYINVPIANVQLFIREQAI